MDQQNSDHSVEEWIARARRARELVNRVDFQEVAGHDPQAIEKLVKVTDALNELSEGRNVEYVPGVDEDEAPEVDETWHRTILLPKVPTASSFPSAGCFPR